MPFEYVLRRIRSLEENTIQNSDRLVIQLVSMGSRFPLKLLVHGMGSVLLMLRHWLYLGGELEICCYSAAIFCTCDCFACIMANKQHTSERGSWKKRARRNPCKTTRPSHLVKLFTNCCWLPTPMTLASGRSPMFPLVVHQPASLSIWPAVQSLRWGLSTNPGVTMWCVRGCS